MFDGLGTDEEVRIAEEMYGKLIGKVPIRLYNTSLELEITLWPDDYTLLALWHSVIDWADREENLWCPMIMRAHTVQQVELVNGWDIDERCLSQIKGPGVLETPSGIYHSSISIGSMAPQTGTIYTQFNKQ